MSSNASQYQESSDSFSNFYVDDQQENREKIEISILYVVFHNFQRFDKGLTEL